LGLKLKIQIIGINEKKVKNSLILPNKNIFMITAKELDNETNYTYLGANSSSPSKTTSLLNIHF
ncbi:MAG TPA: hypothetical protein PLV79_05845, partial [Bacteroidales bacterium]|nr:hypothetical protein [Bacteroidales bacterium]HRS70164.1 hypothetical protein [Bacteroidales bacterium]